MKLGWRVCFAVASLAILIGGPMHPGGTMAQMLAHPDWIASHLWQLLGYAALVLGLVLASRDLDLNGAAARWTRYAVVGAALQTVEMVMHALAMVDAEKLATGQATPVLTTHLVMAVLFYPLFAIGMIGFIVTTSGAGVLGSRWIAWLGVLGAASHGLAPVLVIGLEWEAARILFPAVMLFAVWLMIVALMPARTSAR